MSFWYDIKNRNYSSDKKGSWIRAYVDRVTSILRADCDKKTDEHFAGILGRHSAVDVDCSNGKTVQECLDSETASRLEADSAVRQEFAAADSVVRQEFAAADSVIRQEFAVEDNVVRQEFASEDAAIRQIIAEEASAREAADGSLADTISTKAPASHASTATTYGVGTSTNYGHLKVADNLTTTTSGTALSANQGKVLKADIDALPIKVFEEGTSVSTTSGETTEVGTSAVAVGDLRSRSYGTYTSGSVATGDYSLALGAGATAKGNYSTAIGEKSHATGHHSNTLGYGASASGGYSVAIGTSANANGTYSIAMLQGTAEGERSIAMGSGTTASGKYSLATGYKTSANKQSSTAIGESTTADNTYALATGYGTTASGMESVATGYQTTAGGAYSVSMGQSTTASGAGAVSMGRFTTAGNYQLVCGAYSKEQTGGNGFGTTGSAFYIGNGTGTTDEEGNYTALSNCFRVTYAGSVYGLAAYNSSGADIAELYEWKDGNPDNEDRRGLFVTLDGTKIRLATPEDTYIKGVISARPCLVGDSASESWHGKYLTDVFGEPIVKTVHCEAEYEETEVTDPETGESVKEKVLIRDEYDAEEFVLNPDYDPNMEYVARESRPEYSYVSSWGKITLVDDGTCEVNGFATVGEGGKATKSSTQTMYRVMERKDDSHIYVAVG